MSNSASREQLRALLSGVLSSRTVEIKTQVKGLPAPNGGTDGADGQTDRRAAHNAPSYIGRAAK